ncbi:hypothetical protein RB3276 [Rhodopirellula baltica SH 1]|uniref:Uncharacterized protein n=2 Tax=Rhodopirellula baltica TaxID=265606 RepID=Q7UUI2_RHOBA|nr:hypothetical protein RB3276 [Rhodopirellula baltica SH 1]
MFDWTLVQPSGIGFQPVSRAEHDSCNRLAGSLSHFRIVAGRTLVCPGRPRRSLVFQKLAMWIRRSFSKIESNENAISRIRCGRIVMRDGRLERIEQHWARSPISVAQVWWQAKFGKLEGDICCLDFHVPRGMSAFVTLDYVRSGNATRYATAIGASKVLDEIARLRKSYAIVAHVSNARITDRHLERAGWERHLLDWPGRHFIRRMHPAVSVSQ